VSGHDTRIRDSLEYRGVMKEEAYVIAVGSDRGWSVLLTLSQLSMVAAFVMSFPCIWYFFLSSTSSCRSKGLTRLNPFIAQQIQTNTDKVERSLLLGKNQDESIIVANTVSRIFQ